MLLVRTSGCVAEEIRELEEGSYQVSQGLRIRREAKQNTKSVRTPESQLKGPALTYQPLFACCMSVQADFGPLPPREFCIPACHISHVRICLFLLSPRSLREFTFSAAG